MVCPVSSRKNNGKHGEATVRKQIDENATLLKATALILFNGDIF